MAVTSEAFNVGPEASWEFWNESPTEVRKTIRRWLDAKVNFVAQELGHFDAALWAGFLVAVSLRHPIDRIYSHYLQHRDGDKLSTFRSFDLWVSSLQPSQREVNPLVMHFGRGDVEVAVSMLQKFDVILDVDD